MIRCINYLLDYLFDQFTVNKTKKNRLNVYLPETKKKNLLGETFMLINFIVYLIDY